MGLLRLSSQDIAEAHVLPIAIIRDSVGIGLTSLYGIPIKAISKNCSRNNTTTENDLDEIQRKHLQQLQIVSKKLPVPEKGQHYVAYR